MVKTRGIKRSTTTLDQKDLDLLDQLEDEELWLEEEEVANAEKKRKTLHWLPLTATFESLEPVLPRILSYVNDVRELYQLSMTTKTLRQCITTEMILRACVFAPNNTNQRSMCATLMEKVQERSLRPPSHFRLLRLLNAKRCERGADCYGCDRNTGLSMSLTGRTRPFGLAICRTCLPVVSAGSSLIRGINRYYTAWVRNPRILHENGSFLLGDPKEAVTGDKIGPYVSSLDVKQIDTTYPRWKAGVEEERAQAVVGLLERIDEETPDEEKAYGKMLIETYEKVQADYNTKEQNKILKRQENAEAKRLARINSRRPRIQSLLDTLEEMLIDYSHKDIALRGSWCEHSGNHDFRYGISQGTIGPLLQAPASCTEEKLTAAVDNMKRAYNMVFFNGFGTGNNQDFLKFLRNATEPSQVALYNYKNDFPESWIDRDDALTLLGYADMEFVEKMELRGPLYAFVRSTPQRLLENVFVKSVASAASMNKKVLARAIWKERTRNYQPYSNMTPTSFRLVFQRSKEEFETLSTNLDNYLREDTVIAFMNETSSPTSLNNAPHWRRHYMPVFTRQEIVKQFHELKHGSRELIQNRTFAQLLALHQVLFNNPSMQR